jgi:hypothetical protein
MPGRSDMPGHIYFAPVPNRLVPTEKDQLRHDIEVVARSLRELFAGKDLANDPRFREHFRSLLSAAQLGLLCGDANPAQGRAALDTLKDNVLESELKAVKNGYLNRLGKWVAGSAIVFVVVGLAVGHFWPTLASAGKPSNYAFMLAAAMPAMWLSFVTRKQKWTFADLCRPEEDLMQPGHRIAYVVCFTSLLALICGEGIAGVSVGNFSTAKIGESLGSAIIFGTACGLSEKLLATTIAPHITRIMSGLGRAAHGEN